MALPCYVHLIDHGLVGEDDGTSAWRKIEVQLTVRGQMVRANLLTDGYTGNRTVRIVRDDIGLDRAVARTLMLEVYDVSCGTMLEYESDLGEAFFDLERLIDRVFYTSQARDLTRRIAKTA